MSFVIPPSYKASARYRTTSYPISTPIPPALKYTVDAKLHSVIQLYLNSLSAIYYKALISLVVRLHNYLSFERQKGVNSEYMI